jgi:hypothetical protein
MEKEKRMATAQPDMTDEEFLERWQLWRTALNGRDDSHSLVQQVESLCWDIATYEALMASWRSEMASDGETLHVNTILFHFIMDNFTKSLCLDLRRLTEEGELIAPPISKRDHSVYSLQSLIANIAEHRKQYTRRRLFLASKLEYDVEEIGRRHWEFVHQNYPNGGTYSVPPELNDIPSKLTHSQWDKLSRTSPTLRGTEDLIAADHLDRLQSEVAAIRKEVEFVVNKHLAHAATPKSMQSVESKKESIRLSELIELVIRAGRAVNSVSVILWSAVFPFLAYAQFDKWEHWGRGWNVPPKTLEEAWRKWQGRVERIEPTYSSNEPICI